MIDSDREEENMRTEARRIMNRILLLQSKAQRFTTKAEKNEASKLPGMKEEAIAARGMILRAETEILKLEEALLRLDSEIVSSERAKIESLRS